nr:efflux RND transporter permease subunit [Comamonas sp.]
ASQRAIGTGVIGGMLTATVLGVLFVPIFFVWVLSRFQGRKSTGASASTSTSHQPAADAAGD